MIMHQYAYFGKGRTIHPIQIAIQMDNDSNGGYPPKLDSNSLDKNSKHIFYMLHLDEYSSKVPWIIQSHVPLKGKLS